MTENQEAQRFALQAALQSFPFGGADVLTDHAARVRAFIDQTPAALSAPTSGFLTLTGSGTVDDPFGVIVPVGVSYTETAEQFLNECARLIGQPPLFGLSDDERANLAKPDPNNALLEGGEVQPTEA